MKKRVLQQHYERHAANQLEPMELIKRQKTTAYQQQKGKKKNLLLSHVPQLEHETAEDFHEKKKLRYIGSHSTNAAAFS